MAVRLRRRMSKRRSKLRKIIAVLMILLCLGTAAFFGWKIYSMEQEYAEGDAAYNQLAELVVTPENKDEEPGESPAPPVQEEHIEEIIENDVPSVNIEAAQTVNSDIMVWLYSPETVIDYPVCHGEDNDYYLTHLADGTYNLNGCLFIDYRNEPDFADKNTLIYGHHMQSGKMFASLINYANQSYYDAHPVMYLTLGEKIYRLELFSGYTTTMDSNAYELNFSTDHDFAEWLREISGRSDFRPAQLTLSTEDHIVTLSTCAYAFQDARYVVHGRLVEL